jgi:hypothetical protein
VGGVLQQPGWLASLISPSKPCSRGFTALPGPPSHDLRRSEGRSSLPPSTSSQRAPAAPSPPAQLLSLRGFAAAAAAGGGRPAALRRLRRAGARVSGRAGREAALARVEAGGGEVEAGPATDVQPREGSASDLQVASVVDHPALIITRPVEW